MPSASERASVFVETEAFRGVRNALESGSSPLLVLGAGGSGKTTLLMALADEWVRFGRRSVFIPLRTIGRGEDLYLILRRELVEYSPPSRRNEAGVVAGSGRASLRATLEVIESAPSDLLLLFDGLDELPDPSPVLQLLDLMSGSASAKVVVASRDTFGGSRSLFRSVFKLTGFSAESAAEFIRRSGGAKLDSSAIEYIIKSAEGSPLALSLMLGLVREHGVPVDGDLGPSREILVRRLFERGLQSIDSEHREEYLRALISLAILNRPVLNSASS
jgi:NACHT domain